MTAARDIGTRGITWDLTDLYASPDDPALKQDLAAALERAKAFAGRYRGTINVPGGPAPEWMAAAVAEPESITEQADKPAIYAGLLHAADARPPEHGALLAMTQEKGSEIRNHLLFFELEWLALDDAAVRPIIDAPACARYRHYLSSARRYRPHILSEPEERLLEETANTGRRAFNRLRCRPHAAGVLGARTACAATALDGGRRVGCLDFHAKRSVTVHQPCGAASPIGEVAPRRR